MIGSFAAVQISALLSLTSAIAVAGSRGALLAKAKVYSLSKVFAPGRVGRTIGGVASFSSFSMEASDVPSTGPGFQVTSNARIASMHCPNVLARTATPVVIVARSVTPGIRLTLAALLIDRTVPLIVGARHTMVGQASGMSRSVANSFWPVMASSASTRPCGLPMILNSDSGLSSTATCLSCRLAAFSASSP